MTNATPDGLARLEQHLEAATKGPWTWTTDTAPDDYYLLRAGTAIVISANGMHTDGWINVSHGDAQLIALAPLLATHGVALARAVEKAVTEMDTLGQLPAPWDSAAAGRIANRLQTALDQFIEALSAATPGQDGTK